MHCLVTNFSFQSTFISSEIDHPIPKNISRHNSHYFLLLFNATHKNKRISRKSKHPSFRNIIFNWNNLFEKENDDTRLCSSLTSFSAFFQKNTYAYHTESDERKETELSYTYLCSYQRREILVNRNNFRMTIEFGYSFDNSCELFIDHSFQSSMLQRSNMAIFVNFNLEPNDSRVAWYKQGWWEDPSGKTHCNITGKFVDNIRFSFNVTMRVFGNGAWGAYGR